MKKITFLSALFLLTFTFSFSQDLYKRIIVHDNSKSTQMQLMQIGIDLHCGVIYKGNDIQIEVSEYDLEKIKDLGIPYNVEIEDLTSYYGEKAKNDLPKAQMDLKLQQSKSKASKTIASKSISSKIKDNYLQYTGSSEVNWVTPTNFHLGSMGGCLTLDEMKAELDLMRAYSVNNGLNIVSVKKNASSKGITTWGNPASSTTNNGITYTGQGTSKWNPNIIDYIRITGNDSGTPEKTKPQMLFTSMIHAREVSALMNNIYFMWYLIENYNADPAIKELIDNNELYFVPVVNPDGLRWNQHLNSNGGGMQRKNLRPNTGGTGNTSSNRGIDLNRNFNYFWGYNNIGSSGTATSETYRGSAPESEPETKIMVDFITSRNFKSAVWNHSYANSVPHPYGGIPTKKTGREDEYYRWHEEMTKYNRYLYGATIFYESNGLPDDWMMGGAPDNNGATGSGQAIIATTPEHGGQGFWPTPSTIVPIAKQSMRISLGTIYYGGKYAKLHDLTQSNISNLTSSLDFGIEQVGQTASNFNVTVTPISSNITSITSPATQTGMSVLQQRTVTAQLVLKNTITANEKIEYNVKLSNDNGIIYNVNYVKYYQPTLLFNHNPDTNGLTGWTQSGGWSNTTVDAYSNNNSLRSGSYTGASTKTLTTTNSYNFSNSDEVTIQFYTKWDIERNYDFVEVLGSPDGGTNWISLKGNYTKPNATSSTTNHDNKNSSYANFQANSKGQIYDGDRMDNWVMEEITIDNTYATLLNSSNVKIRFNFRSDALNVSENYTTTSDGFFIDDFKIISIPSCVQPAAPATACYETATFDTNTCAWVLTGTQPAAPATACYETAAFDTNSCAWIVTGTQPAAPTTACYETAAFDTNTCAWVVSGSQPAVPATACYETATFDTGTCAWIVSGYQPAAPVTACYETATFDTNICAWIVTGTQPAAPTTACYEIASFDTNSCAWVVTGTQPAAPTTACYETAAFDTNSCNWIVTGNQPVQPATACYETAAFDTNTCAWVVSGSQPAAPTTACYEIASFDTNTCAWVVTGTQPAAPTTACYEIASFDTNTCAWVVIGTQPVQPATACYETASFDTNACAWVVTGTQPTEPIITNCWETTSWNATDCKWDVSGTPNVYYADADNDGYGDPNNSISDCTAPVGYVSNNADCDDTNANINPNTVWYADADGDGFGNKNVKLIQCTQPAGYVSDKTDCYDNDANFNPNTIWYFDGDFDGFGNPDITLTQCNKPIGYVSNNADCDDSNPYVFPGTIEIPGNGIDDDCNPATLDGALEINDFNIENIQITPNPFNNRIIIKVPLSYNNSEFNIKVFDLNGRLVFNNKYVSTNGTITVTELHNLEQAPYLVKITCNKTGNSILKRLIKY